MEKCGGSLGQSYAQIFVFVFLMAKLCPENAVHCRMFVSVSDAWGGERVDTKERKMRWFVRAKLCPNFSFCLLSAKLCPENAGHGRMFVSVSDAWGGAG